MSDVLQEYLVKVGYKVDEGSFKALTGGLNNLQTRVSGVETTAGKAKMALGGLGFVMAGVGLAMGESAYKFAVGMRQVYSSSEKAGVAVSKLQGLSEAADTFGVSGNELTSAIQKMNLTFQNQPAMKQMYADLFHINTVGKDASGIFMDVATSISKMPQGTQAGFVSQFLGMDYGEFTVMMKHLPEIMEQAKKLADLKAKSGIDSEDTKKTLSHYTSTIDALTTRFSSVFIKGLTAGVPLFDKMATITDHIAEGWGLIFDRISGKKPGEGSHVDTMGAAPDELERKAAFDSKLKQRLTIGGDKFRLAAEAEKRYGLPVGTLRGIMGAESNFGDPRFLQSKAGALGPMQIMPGTGVEMGASPSDLMNMKRSVDLAGRIMQKNLRRFKGNMRDALTAYNSGAGNVIGNRLGPDGKGYADRVAKFGGVTLGDSAYQKNSSNTSSSTPITINMNGAVISSHADAKELGNSMGEAVRNSTGLLTGAGR